MFRFHRHELSIQVTVRNQFGEMFHNMSLRSNRIGGHYVHIAEAYGFSGCNGYFNAYLFSHHSPSCTISMASTGHS